jgi:hypothetical protein
MTKYETLVRGLRDQALAAMSEHDKECQNPGTCLEPINVAAFIAHSLGLRPEHMIDLTGILGELKAKHDAHLAECKDPEHKHG